MFKLLYKKIIAILCIKIAYLDLRTYQIKNQYNLKINKSFERKIVNIYLSISFNICFGCSREPSHSDGSFEYPQHIFLFEK